MPGKLLHDLVFAEGTSSEVLTMNPMNLRRLHLSLVYLPKQGTGHFPVVTLYLVWVRHPGGSWTMVLTQAKTEADGEILCDLGAYPPGTALEIRFGVFAVNEDVEPIGDTPGLAVFVIENGSNAQRIAQHTKLERTDQWEETASYRTQEV